VGKNTNELVVYFPLFYATVTSEAFSRNSSAYFWSEIDETPAIFVHGSSQKLAFNQI